MINLQIGDEVYFTDPDQDISSGVYRVVQILLNDGDEPQNDTIVIIENNGVAIEVFLDELS